MHLRIAERDDQLRHHVGEIGHLGPLGAAPALAIARQVEVDDFEMRRQRDQIL